MLIGFIEYGHFAWRCHFFVCVIDMFCLFLIASVNELNNERQTDYVTYNGAT